MTMIVPDRNHVTALDRTYELIGPLYPIVVDQDGKMLAGYHRIATGKPWPTQTREVKSELERSLIRLLSNVQREPSEEERKYLINKVAEALMLEKHIPEETVCSELVSMFCPAIFSERTVQRLLEKRFKAKTLHKKDDSVSSSSANSDISNLQKKIEKKKNMAKMALDDMSKRTDGETHYPYPDCKCSSCPHSGDCY